MRGVVPPVSAPVSCSQTGGLQHANGLSSPPGLFYPTYPNEDLLKDLEDYIAAEMFTSGSAQMVRNCARFVTCLTSNCLCKQGTKSMLFACCVTVLPFHRALLGIDVRGCP